MANKSLTRTELEAQEWKRIVFGLSRLTPAKKLEQALDALLSNYEKKMLVKRVLTLELLRAGKSYREIGKALWISSGTINAIRKSFIRASKDYVSSRKKDENRNLGSATDKQKSLIKREKWVTTFLNALPKNELSRIIFDIKYK